MKRLIIVISVFLASASALPAHSAGAAARVEINDVHVIHFIIDGTNLKTFNKALEDGKLPTVKKLFYDEGAVFTQGMSTFPTTSTSVYQAYSTGLFPGHAGIPHLERFDRQREEVVGYLTVSGFNRINSDFINLKALTNPGIAKLQPPSTIFELLDGHPTEVVYSSFSRGASKRYPKTAPIHALWSTYVSEAPEDVDVLAMKQVTALFKGPADRIPRYALVGLYSSDISGHKYGPASAEVTQVLVQFDVFLRDFLKLLAERGIADRTYIIVSADHGMHRTGRLFKLRDALKGRGIHLKSSNPPRRGYALYVANRGVVSSHIYVRHDGGFEPIEDAAVARHVPTIDGEDVDLIEFLAGLPATEFVIVRSGERTARIYGRDGSWAEASWYNVGGTDYVSCRTHGGDPLGYSKNRRIKKLLDGRPHSALAWRDATAGEHYPDAVVNLSQIFHDGRAGDIYVTSRGRYGFRKVKKGNHGGIIEDDMRTPLMMSGPTVPRGRFGAIRPVDVYPLLIEWFGLEVPEGNYDGRDPFQKREGVDRSGQRLAAMEMRADQGRRIGRDRRLAPLARREAARRGAIVERLSALLDDLKENRTPDDPYADDHMAIVARALKWAKEAKARMDLVLASLTGGRKG